MTGPRGHRLGRWATALALLIVAGFYEFHNFGLSYSPAPDYDWFYDAVAVVSLTAIIVSLLTTRLGRVWRATGFALWLTAVVWLTIAGILAEYTMIATTVGDAILFWAMSVNELPVSPAALSAVAVLFGFTVTGPPARSAVIDNLNQFLFSEWSFDHDRH